MKTTKKGFLKNTRSAGKTSPDGGFSDRTNTSGIRVKTVKKSAFLIDSRALFMV